MKIDRNEVKKLILIKNSKFRRSLKCLKGSPKRDVK